MKSPYDALLVVSFGGPDKRQDVIPFLENVLRGRVVPRARLLEVAEHYYHFDGRSPLNAQIRALIDALRTEFEQHRIDLPIYWGNRNWHPLLRDTIAEMAVAGVRRALAFVTSAFSSYSGCRQYRENIWHAQRDVGKDAPVVDKLRVFYDHPRFIATMAERTANALQRISLERQDTTQIVFTAHSIPLVMADACQYQQQLRATCGWIMTSFAGLRWNLVYQSRSGPPSQPWLEPDVCDHLRQLQRGGDTTDVVLVPVGFMSDHMEVKYDLDTEAQAVCDEIGLNMVRADSAGTHPGFVTMIRELIEERLYDRPRAGLDSGPSVLGLCGEPCCWPGRSDFVPYEMSRSE